jgi:hypothetical protein
MHRAIQPLTGGLVKLKKGGVVAVEGRELHVLLRPAEIELIAGE